MIQALRTALALALLASFYVLFILVGLFDVALLLLALWAQVNGASGSTNSAGSTFMVIVGSVPLLYAIGHGLMAVSRPTPVGEHTARVTRRTAPELWRTVTEVAGRVGVSPPDLLLLTAEANAAVSEEGWLLGLLPGERRLYLGLPLTMTLTRAQLRAVLAHEFGHYAGRHTRFGGVAYRVASAMEITFERLRPVPGRHGGISLGYLLAVPLRPYRWLFHRLTFAVRRRQELEADDTAAGIAGREVTAVALRTALGTAVAWRRFSQEWLEPAEDAALRPDNPFLAFRSLLEEADTDVLRIPAARFGEKPGRYDSHPPLAVRLARLAALDTDSARDDGTAAAALLPADLGRIVRRVRGLPPGTRSLPWQEWAEQAAGRPAQERAAALLRAARRTTEGGQPTLGTVLELLGDGHAGPLAREFGEEPEGDGDLHGALRALVGQHLVGAGRAHWRPAWGGESELECPGLTGRALDELVRDALATPAGLAPLRTRLAALGVDLGRPVPAGGPEPEPGSRQPASVSITPVSDEEAAAEKRKYLYLTVAVAAVALVLIVVGALSSSGDGSPALPPGIRCTYGADGNSCLNRAYPPTWNPYPGPGYGLPTPYPIVPRPTFSLDIGSLLKPVSARPRG